MRIPLLILALSLACCGAPGEPAPEESQESVEAAGETLAPQPEQMSNPDPPACAVSFVAPEELTEVMMWAAALWSDETGCVVKVGGDGIPWVVLDEVYLLDGRPAKGRTVAAEAGQSIVTLSVEMRRDMLTDPYGPTVVLHEMGHALGGYRHLADGLLAEQPADGQGIDPPARALVCERLACSGEAVPRDQNTDLE